METGTDPTGGGLDSDLLGSDVQGNPEPSLNSAANPNTLEQIALSGGETNRQVFLDLIQPVSTLQGGSTVPGGTAQAAGQGPGPVLDQGERIFLQAGDGGGGFLSVVVVGLLVGFVLREVL